ncbi:MAG: tetratricopeptide repeat protein [Candidatus Eisenbacteria bacterium]|uniref:Tetratricopeptide repeat protein n=1 Tax=Eiseniibacteriota bacterium TaxID=2212470 RepID=A0A948RUY9_UNCEI|nr:tetratricopeptide repeat protein [Candidatus Eisenbacteria bacterium]MBU1949217.1 tetratricopeptide repeat protein [Candidatus Eisenbacteria bacterium]MBU2689442.1 tetratricopeptide repeat protein [Candidatus Eisenbacteria bacterium]
MSVKRVCGTSLMIIAALVVTFFLFRPELPDNEAGEQIAAEATGFATATHVIPEVNVIPPIETTPIPGDARDLSEAPEATPAETLEETPAEEPVETVVETAALTASTVVEPPLSDSERYAAAIEQLQAGDAEGARPILSKLLNTFHGRPAVQAKVRANLARALLALGREREALPHAEEASRIDPENSGAWNVRGRALLSLQRSEEALRAFQTAIEKDPGNFHALNNIGYIWILREDFLKARTYLDEAVVAAAAMGVEPPSYTFNNLGVALERMGDLSDAREAYSRALGGGHPTAGLGLARVGALLAAEEPSSIPGSSADSTLTAGTGN